MENCIFCCVFTQDKYVDMFYLLLESIYAYGNLDNNTIILIYTSTVFMNKIKKNYLFNEQKIKFEINDSYDDIDKACKARLNLFNLSSVKNYNKILYLDLDIIVKDDITKIFNICKEDILYVLEEGSIDFKKDFWGKTLFGNEINNYEDKSAFTSGILLFNNCKKINDLFNKINEDIIKRPYNFTCFDQPYIIYSAFKYNLYNNKILKSFAVNNDNNIHSDKIIHHFPGGPGIYTNKLIEMNNFLNNLNKHNFIINMKIFDVKNKPKKNNSFPLVGLCVSYNYFDTLQFMLPVNYLHFEKIYLITQENDIDTIEFCKKFDNVTVLFYNFKNNNKSFDKYGALNYIQNLAYNEYPESWYLIIDSDIILPNNLINILINENLNPDCIYGAIRNNVDFCSELLNKKKIINNEKNIYYPYNNILNDLIGIFPPSILGCFQLYKKHCYHRTIHNDAGFGDYFFGYDNFKIFCNLENILYFHLGPIAKNWDGKVEGFNHDIKLSLNNIYYECHKKVNNIYYNEERQLIKYGNSQNIDNDIMTCSEKFRFDIYNFFKDKSNYNIAEIGAYKGYTTKILANIFLKVYAVDNNLTWTNFSKNYNKDAINIEYVSLDIYKDSWNIIPRNIDVSFIDAGYSYEDCKNDALISIESFNDLKYIIFNNYGVWDGVKKIVDQLIERNLLIFEKFIGINDVPGPNGIVYNVNEGIICRVNKKINNKLINKTYSWGDSNITFLDNFEMNAFGKGNYRFIGKNNIIAKFGKKEHEIEFNDDYTVYTSIRLDDLCIMNGLLILDNTLTLINKVYSWGNSNIKFLDNFKLDAFGEGDYKIIDKNNIIANFGCKEHNIEFINDYTEFISTRKDDPNIVINGKLIFDTTLINKTYSFGKSRIKFLDNFKINIIREEGQEGHYIFINKYNIIVNFQNIEYNIMFNNNLTEYISTITDDSTIIKGRLLFDISLINKTYSWGDSNITFFDDFKMDAFGIGLYTYKNKYNITAVFGKKEHNIEFNNDFTEYTSIRKDDSCIVKGKLIY